MSDVAGEMLEAGMPAVEVMTEYVRACRLLGHSTPDPARLYAAYTAEEGMDLQALDADGRALAAAVTAAEDALLLQEHARRTLAAAWRGAGAEAAADHLRRHADASGAAADGLRGAADTMGELRNRLWQLVDAKIDTTQSIEARGLRAEWLSAARTVTTGAGDRADASELVDIRVAPFVVNDVGADWVTSMRDNESAIRQAYGTAAAAMTGGASVVFDSPGELGPAGTQTPVPVAAEQVSSSNPSVGYASVGPATVGTAPAGLIAATAPAGYQGAPMTWSDPAPAQTVGAPAVAAGAPGPPAATSPFPAAPPDSAAATPAAPPMSSLGGLGGGASPLGSGLAGLSGAGQSFADILGGLLGSGGGGLGEGAVDDLNRGLDDDLADELEDPEPGDVTEEDVTEEDTTEDEEADDETPSVDPAATAADPAPEGTVESIEAVVPEPEPPVPTPVPEPLAETGVAAPAEPAPADTPCEIAADELPQAGP